MIEKKNNLKEGNRKQYQNDQKYIGKFNQDKFHDENGILKHKKVVIYKGGFNMGTKEGLGKEFDFETNNLKYQGTFMNDLRNTKNGKLFFEDRKNIRYQGEFREGKPYAKEGETDDLGKIFYKNGCIEYIGEIKNGIPNGWGKVFMNEGASSNKHFDNEGNKMVIKKVTLKGERFFIDGKLNKEKTIKKIKKRIDYFSEKIQNDYNNEEKNKIYD